MNAAMLGEMASKVSDQVKESASSAFGSAHSSFASQFASNPMPFNLPSLHSLLPFPVPSMHFLSSLSTSDLTNLFSIRWWLLYIVNAYDQEPGHVMMEITCVLCILYLLFRRPYDPKKEEQLSEAEEEKLIQEWQPVALAPKLPAHCDTTPASIVSCASGAKVQFANNTNDSYLNFASCNFLGLASHEEVLRTCLLTIEKYGVGSCGPRGFYGSFDVHLELEAAISQFYSAESCILYSDGLACLSSVIPAFAKRGDLIIADEMCNYAIQQGIRLSRSNAHFFAHNDVSALEVQLKKMHALHLSKGKNHKLNRRFIVVEGLYQYTGQICKLVDVCRLAKQYKYRVLIDDSLALGVLGRTGRGSIEHHALDISDVDLLCATMDAAMGTIGGFCVGSHTIVNHQRLSGAGYCFSASSPPYSSAAGCVAVRLIQEDTQRIERLKANIRLFHSKLQQELKKSSASHHAKNYIEWRITSSPESATVHIQPFGHGDSSDSTRLSHLDLCRRVRSTLKSAHQICIQVPDFIAGERCPALLLPSLRVIVCEYHSESQLLSTALAIARVCNQVWASDNSHADFGSSAGSAALIGSHSHSNGIRRRQ